MVQAHRTTTPGFQTCAYKMKWMYIKRKASWGSKGGNFPCHRSLKNCLYVDWLRKMGDSIPSLPGKVTRRGASAASLSLEADLGHPVGSYPQSDFPWWSFSRACLSVCFRCPLRAIHQKGKDRSSHVPLWSHFFLSSKKNTLKTGYSTLDFIAYLAAHKGRVALFW